jgi:hypothetical protein
MSKTISALAAVGMAQARQAPPPQADRNARNVFKVLHGQFGNLFLSRFATGELDGLQRDKGVQNAMAIWARDLERFDGATIEQALGQCLQRSAE